MASVLAPNGDVYEMADAVASGLVGSDGAGWEYAKDKPTKVARVPAKPDSFKKK